jgi:hypothetical protein
MWALRIYGSGHAQRWFAFFRCLLRKKFPLPLGDFLAAAWAFMHPLCS